MREVTGSVKLAHFTFLKGEYLFKNISKNVSLIVFCPNAPFFSLFFKKGVALGFDFPIMRIHRHGVLATK
uniref:Uncharacterized protein n=1 Tax=Pseudoalteromonas rubra TaxID=43658 RepID=A0A0F4QAI1_9GAMM|nr:hypothetical protein TW77_23280 [Pseudoalteromonas rubra]